MIVSYEKEKSSFKLQYSSQVVQVSNSRLNKPNLGMHCNSKTLAVLFT